MAKELNATGPVIDGAGSFCMATELWPLIKEALGLDLRMVRSIEIRNERREPVTIKVVYYPTLGDLNRLDKAITSEYRLVKRQHTALPEHTAIDPYQGSLAEQRPCE